jgi:hypothetical protein
LFHHGAVVMKYFYLRAVIFKSTKKYFAISPLWYNILTMALPQHAVLNPPPTTRAIAGALDGAHSDGGNRKGRSDGESTTSGPTQGRRPWTHNFPLTWHNSLID